jgi:predicted  nucleic acid-binding Zn-ribbon protein
MEKDTFTRHALSAMPSTPDEVIFLASVLVAFFSGALLVDWICRFRDLEAQKQWHDTQMKTFQKGFGPLEKLPRHLIAIQTSLDELQGKLVTVFGRFNDMSDRTDAIGRAVDHVHKHQHQDVDIKKPSLAQTPITAGSTDVSELLVGIQKIQETLIANGLGASSPGSAQPPSTVEPVLPSLNASTSTPIQIQETNPLHPRLDHTIPRLEAQLSGLQKRCDTLIGKNVDLAQKLETSQAINAEIEDNAKEVANVYWKRPVDNEIPINRDNKENIKRLENKIENISQHKGELEQASAELRRESERLKSSQEIQHLKAYKESLKDRIGQAEDTIREFEQELERQRQIASDQAEVLEKQETKIATQSSEMSNLEEGLSSVVKNCMGKEEKMEKQESEIKDLKNEVLSTQHDRTRMEQEIEDYLTNVSGLEDKLSSAEHDRTKLEEDNKRLSQLHESARQSMTRQGVIIEDLRERLETETAKSAKIQSYHDDLAIEADKNNAQISGLEAERLQDKREIGDLAHQLESCEKQYQRLEGELKEHEQARENGQEAQKYAENVSKDTASDSPELTNEPQPGITKQVTSPRQSELGTTSDEKREEETAPDSKAESTIFAASPASTSGEPGADEDPSIDVQGGDVVEDDTPVTNHRVVPGTGANEGLTGKRDWAEEDDGDFEFIHGVGAEVQKPTAETTVLPSVASSAKPPAQETPFSPAADPQPALNNTANNDTPDAIVPNNDRTTTPPLPTIQPPTPSLVTEYCKNCDTDIQLETFLDRDGNQQLNWRKHLKEAKCKPKLPNLVFKAQRKSGSVPPSPATPNSGTYPASPAR